MTSALRVGFLGPLGTFTEQALKTQPDLAAAEHVLFRTMPDVLDAADSGEVDLGFVAIENNRTFARELALQIPKLLLSLAQFFSVAVVFLVEQERGRVGPAL